MHLSLVGLFAELSSNFSKVALSHASCGGALFVDRDASHVPAAAALGEAEDCPKGGRRFCGADSREN